MTNSSIRVLGPREPWFHAATKYLDAGWSPFPLGPGKKHPPEEGATGGKNPLPDGSMVAEWLRERPKDSNIGVRIPKDIICIDVDAYSGGHEQLKSREREWGKLPPTWRNSARNDGVGGHMFFRLPEGYHNVRWPGNLGKGLDILQFNHRYSVVWPSVNPDDAASIYRWYQPGDATEGAGHDGIPLLENVSAHLPMRWVKSMTSGEAYRLMPKRKSTPAHVKAWLRDQRQGDMCSTMRKAVERAEEKIGSDGGHDPTTSFVYRVVMLSQEGHAGLRTALTRVQDAFMADVTDDDRTGDVRDPESAFHEFQRMMHGAVETALARAEEDEEWVGGACSCFVSKMEIPEDENDVGWGRVAVDPQEYPRNDSGNAMLLHDMFPHDFLWLPDTERWMVWDGGIWESDRTGAVVRLATEVANIYDERADQLAESDEAEVKQECTEYRKWAVQCGNVNRIEAMMKMTRSLPDIAVSAAHFDSNPGLLHCANGVLELGKRVTFRESSRDDYLSMSTGTTYVPDARNPLWEDYLNKFLPDMELRAYVQAAAGYSLWGENTGKMIFFLHGPGDTGKTTFVETVGAALGAYAGPFGLSSFHGNVDDKPRPDILKSFPRRFIFASEASGSWKLHADMIKKMTGGDTMDARQLYGKEFTERKPAFTSWVATNPVPHIPDADEALVNRLRVLPFTSVVRGGLASLGAARALQAPAARTAVLAWCVAGWQQYQKHGLVMPQSVVAATKTFVGGMSETHSWMENCVHKHAGSLVLVQDMMQSYRNWCAEGGVSKKDMLTESALRTWLKAQGIAITRNARKINGERVRPYDGVKLTTPSGQNEKNYRAKGRGRPTTHE